MTSKEIDIFVSSNTSQGALNVSPDGSQFTVNFSNPIKVTGTGCMFSIKKSTVWFVTPNIINGVNSKLYFNYAATDYIIDLDTGLYDYSGLRNAIAVALGNIPLATDLFVLTSDEATQKTGFIFTGTVIIDFTQTDTFRDVLGWNSVTVSGIAGQTKYANNIANFNTIDSFQVHSDIVSGGLSNNGFYSNIVHIINIPLGTNVGSQIVDTPFNPTKIDCSTLDNKTLTAVKFWITDQNNVSINTRGEIWSALFTLSWK